VGRPVAPALGPFVRARRRRRTPDRRDHAETRPEPSLTRPLEFTQAREQPVKVTPSESSGSPRVPTPAPPCGSATPLSVSPVDPQSLASITPPGNLGPSSHTFPTSHTYMHLRRVGTEAPAPVEIVAPSDGRGRCAGTVLRVRDRGHPVPALPVPRSHDPGQRGRGPW